MHQRYIRPLDQALLRYSVDEHGCHNWQGALSSSGYGVLVTQGRKWLVHRLVALRAGMAIAGQCVCHVCDNRRCINPSHFFVGSRADNRLDCVRKHRHAFGSRQGHAKLTDSQVQEIRLRFAAGESAKKLAPQYGVSQPLVSSIVRGAQWAFSF